MKLEDRVTLITGASKGIGRAIALEFAKEGAIVVVNYARSQEKAIKIVETIKEEGLEALAIKADISKPLEISQMINKIIERYGKVDILINNAAVYNRHSFFESNEETWNSTINTNLKGTYFCSKLAAEKMLEQKNGVIINMASNAGIIPKKERGIEYGISKAGVIYLTKSLALTLAPYIRVNCIAPGYTETDMANFYTDKKLKKGIERSIPLRRINMPDDIAEAALFLASKESKNITGQILVIDGGYSLK